MPPRARHLSRIAGGGGGGGEGGGDVEAFTPMVGVEGGKGAAQGGEGCVEGGEGAA